MSWRRRAVAGWGAVLLALAVLAGCAADKPKPKPLEPVTPKIAGRQVWAAKRRRRALPAVGGRRATAISSSPRATARCWPWKPKAAASCGRANAGAPLSAGVGSDGRFHAVVTTRQQAGHLRRQQGAVARAAEVARQHRAAGGRRACLRDGRRPRGACLRRHGRQAAVDAAAPRRGADAAAHRRAHRVQGHAARRAGPAPGRHRPDARHAALGGAGGLAARHQRGRAPGRPDRSGRAAGHAAVRALVPGGGGLRRHRRAAACCGRATSAASMRSAATRN